MTTRALPQQFSGTARLLSNQFGELSQWAITGTITDNGAPLAGVTVTAGSGSNVTNASGEYEITWLYDDTYTVTPAKSGYSFVPPSLSVTISGGDATGKDFNAELNASGPRANPQTVAGLHIGRLWIHARGFADARPAGTLPVEAMREIGELRASAEGETATAAVSATSGARLMSMSSLSGLSCRLLDDLGGDVFRGRCDSVTLDREADTISLSLASEDQASLPLRRVSELVAVAPEGADQVVPLRWGRTAGFAVNLDASGKRWAWADHPVAGIDRVEVDGRLSQGWQYRDWQDRTGRTVAVIELTAAATEVYAIGRGRYRSGGLIDTPQAVMADIAAIAGLDDMAEQIARGDVLPGLRIAGSIEAETTARAAVRAVAASCGLIWSPMASPGVVALPLAGQVMHYGGRIEDVKRTSPPTRALVSYGRQRAGAAGEVTAILRDAERLGLRRQITLALPWITTSADALAVADRILRDASCDTATAAGLPRRARIGDGVEIDGETWWVRSLLGVGRDASAELVSETRFGALTLGGMTSRIGSTLSSGGGITAASAGTEIRLIDTSGQPVSGAAVTVNGQGGLRTDAGGLVTIPPALLTLPVGTNVVRATRTGYGPVEVRI